MRYAVIIVFMAALLLAACSNDVYYEGMKGLTGEELKAALHERIKDHTVYPYFADSTNATGVGEMMKVVNADPADPNNMILFYSGRSQPYAWADHGDDFDYAQYGVGHDDTWNREHLWAKSHGFSNMGDIAYSDIHHLVPADRTINGSKGAKDFDWGGAPDEEAPDSYTDYDSWEPRDEVKGDLARAMFYMAVRYEGDDDTYDLELVEETGTYGPRLGRLSTLLEWNELDPPDKYERARNDMIYEKFQHNRNPFVDHPEYARLIWGEPDAAPRITASAQWLDFGDVVTGQASPQLTVWITARNLASGVIIGSDIEGLRIEPATLTPENGAAHAPLQLTLTPEELGLVEGDLVLSSEGAEPLHVKLFARVVEPGTHTLLHATFDDGWDGWSAYSVASNKDWRLGSFDKRQFVKISGYRGDEASDDWLISPSINLKGVRSAALRFETAKNHSDDIEGLEVLVSSSFRGDPTRITWTPLDAVFSDGHYNWESSGWLDLSKWEGKKIRVAFRYRCTSPKKSTSWELDDVRVTGVTE